MKIEISDYRLTDAGRRVGKTFEFDSLSPGIARALAAATYQEILSRGQRPPPDNEGETVQLVGLALAFEEIGGGVTPGTEGIRDAVYGARGIEDIR